MSTEVRALFWFSLNGASATKCGLWRYFVAPFVNKTSYTEMFIAVFEFLLIVRLKLATIVAKFIPTKLLLIATSGELVKWSPLLSGSL